MILWLLSHLAVVRSILQSRSELRDSYHKELTVSEGLREALQSASSEKLVLQDRLDSVLEDRSRLWDLVSKSINNERAAYQMQINSQWQKQGFGAPYPEAPKLPLEAIPERGGGTAGRHTAQMPSARVAQATANFINEQIAERKAHQ